MASAWSVNFSEEKPVDNIHASMKDKTQVIEFSDTSKALEEATGIPDIDLFPGVRKWKAAKEAEKVAAAVPAEIRVLVVRKLVLQILGGIFGRK